ncbi:MAG: GatB/YqeY domain-containing protein [Actinomycetota bacterium]
MRKRKHEGDLRKLTSAAILGCEASGDAGRSAGLGHAVHLQGVGSVGDEADREAGDRDGVDLASEVVVVAGRDLNVRPPSVETWTKPKSNAASVWYLVSKVNAPPPWGTASERTMESAVAEVVAANPEVVERIRAGQDKALGFRVGQVMRATRGRANPSLVNEVLRKQFQWAGSG